MFHASCLVHFMFVVSDCTRNPRGGEDKLQYVSQYASAHSMFTQWLYQLKEDVSQNMSPSLGSLWLISLTCWNHLWHCIRVFSSSPADHSVCTCLRQDQSLLYQDTLATSPKSDNLSSARKGCTGHHLHRVCVLPAQSSGLESRSTVKACPWQVTHTVIAIG